MEHIEDLRSLLTLVDRQTAVSSKTKKELSQNCEMGLSITEISLSECTSRRT